MDRTLEYQHPEGTVELLNKFNRDIEETRIKLETLCRGTWEICYSRPARWSLVDPVTRQHRLTPRAGGRET